MCLLGYDEYQRDPGPVSISYITSSHNISYSLQTAGFVPFRGSIHCIALIFGRRINWQQCVRSARQTNQWLDNTKHKSRCFETSRYVMMRCIIRHYNMTVWHFGPCVTFWPCLCDISDRLVWHFGPLVRNEGKRVSPYPHINHWRRF